MQVALVLHAHPHLVAEIAGEGHAAHQHRHHAHIDLAEGHEREGGGREILAHQRLQDLARGGACDGEPDVFHGTGAHGDACGWGMALEPAPVPGLGRPGADQEKALLGETAHGEVADQLAALVQHGGQRHAAYRGHLVGHHAREPGCRAGAAHLELAVVGDLEKPGALAHCAAFLGHVRVGVGATEAHLVESLGSAGREPQRMLEAAVIAEDRVLGLQSLVDRRGAQGARRREFLVGEADAEAARVVLADLGVGVGEGGPVAVAGNVHAPDIGAGVPVHHPLREREPHAAALTETGHHAAGDPEVGEAAHRADQGVAVRGEGEGAIHDFLDARLAELREVLEADLQAGCDAVQVVRQQVLAEVPRRFLGRPGHACFLVGADQHAAALLAQIDLAFEVDAVELLFFAGEEGHIVGDEVLVLHGEDGQFKTDHAAHFAGPQTARVNHMFGVHGALLGDHVPSAVGTLLQRGDAALAHDLGAADLRGLGVGVGHAVRVHVALDGVVHGTGKMLFVHQGKKLFGLVDRDQLELHAKVATAGLGHLQPVEPLAGAGEHDAASDVHAAGLP